MRQVRSMKLTSPLKHPGGRPSKLCTHDKRKILGYLQVLQKEEGRFSSSRTMKRARLKPNEVSSRTIRLFVHKVGYHYVLACRKGLMSEDDMRQQVDFANDIKNKHSRHVSSNTVLFGWCQFLL